MSPVRGVFAAPVVWEVFRFSWVLAMATVGTIFVLYVGDWRSTSRHGLAISATGGLFLLFLSGWTINRIDPSTPSRTGEVSYLACLYIIPLAFFVFGRWRNLSTALLLFMISFFRSGMADFTNSGSKPHSRFSTNHLLEKPSGAL